MSIWGDFTNRVSNASTYAGDDGGGAIDDEVAEIDPGASPDDADYPELLELASEDEVNDNNQENYQEMFKQDADLLALSRVQDARARVAKEILAASERPQVAKSEGWMKSPPTEKWRLG